MLLHNTILYSNNRSFVHLKIVRTSVINHVVRGSGIAQVWFNLISIIIIDSPQFVIIPGTILNLNLSLSLHSNDITIEKKLYITISNNVYRLTSVSQYCKSRVLEPSKKSFMRVSFSFSFFADMKNLCRI